MALNPENRPEFDKAFDEIKALYALTDSDVMCLTQLVMLMQMAGFTTSLLARLLKPMSALFEMMEDFNKKSVK